MLINVMDAVRIKLLKKVVIAKKYKVDTEAGIEYVIYPEDTAPYYAGEIDFSVMLPPIESPMVKSQSSKVTKYEEKVRQSS